MDMRGIEVTNQLRSAIRAKLMELGVRYDEELPDYILVMVVNKKSRQQMHDDLNLFLEDCTTIFVDWLHDQVLKKLQKVTVAKKKSSREFVPTVVVKQEEERKKRKISATSFLEDQAADQPAEKSSTKIAKDDKPAQQKQQVAKLSAPSSELSSKSAEKNAKSGKGKADEVSTSVVGQQEAPAVRRPQGSVRDAESAPTKEVPSPENLAAKTVDTHRDQRASAEAPPVKKRLPETSSGHHDDKREQEARSRPKSPDEEEAEHSATSPDATRKLKSCVNKPRITSVVSVKNRLGAASPRKKFEVYREKQPPAAEGNGRYRQSDNKRFDKHRYGDNGRGGFQRNRGFVEGEDRSRNRNRDDSRHHEASKMNDVRSRIESNKNEKLARNASQQQESLRERSGSKNAAENALAKKAACTVKDRLGLASKSAKLQETAVDWSRNPKGNGAEQPRDCVAKNIKNRLGPLRNNFRPVRKASGRQSGRSSEDEDCLNLAAEMEQEELDVDEQSAVNTGPVKSHIVAVNKSAGKLERRRPKEASTFNAIQHSRYPGAKSRLDKTAGPSSDADEDVDETRLPSKVIVTPRPLKPLQPTQKRATQSLLLRAVAEANQSVVTQKNPEPSLLEKKLVLKRLKPASMRDMSQNLSVHLNSTKRLVMEKIQIELNTSDNLDTEDAEPAPYVPQAVMDEHMGVVMSLFQRSDDNQKFLVTLNGYNNNLMKEKLGSEDDEERLEMEVNEDDELALLTTHNETYTTPAQSELESGTFRITDGITEDDADDGSPKEASEENNENCNTENVDKTDEVPRKRRKLSPIVYNRSHSPSPTRLKTSTLSAKFTDKRPPAESTVPIALDKSRENCRYWPNCTLGNKCAYLHPPVMCSAFPACKFGDKCAYRHPKCKFGLSCTKLGCVFSHPAQQCKYHPFCTKPACPYSHPATSHVQPLATEVTSQRAKFTWRRRD
ncbi:PREDICTED: zinc finger CCCH domain-containing protein 14 isoform X2 [Dinoponera quadriceps]|uniref:Zinc finger CCCH domain-containing protein 14 n=1 Tax=Dinoponera quadriceps TaxID=609295 RepID=A0A6P3X661_DINQU|nr:PREDICTED: zinc finger CCCH domain-containing protein 14 isoform X2 [Dinoponera quadriceps]